MIYEELKENLKVKILPAYIINGGESYLTVLAQKTIEKALNLTFTEFNKKVFADDFKGSAVDIIESCKVLPLASEHRLVVVNDYVGKKNESEKKVFQKYLQNPNPSSCLVFFSTNKSEFFDTLKTSAMEIDCTKVSNNFLFMFLKNRLSESGLQIENSCINKFLDACNYSITNLDTEIAKMASIKLSSQSKIITENDIENNITKNLNYVIFDLTNALSKKDANKVYALIDAMLKNKEQPVSIISTLSNHFRRLFFVSRSDFSKRELSEMLNIKEYAVIKYGEQTRLFSQKSLKEIFDLCLQVEFMAKSGQMEGKNAINYLVANILKK
ncbi:MAG: DNA polymerase III subunit delta [Clostridia bacterium]|nr:DNA polymerase III subunit delta [Clostridia bacterium]